MVTFVVYLMVSSCIMCGYENVQEWKIGSYQELPTAVSHCKNEASSLKGKPFWDTRCETKVEKK